MATDVKECKRWGIIGCGWLGQAFARSVIQRGGSAWGTARSDNQLMAIAETGAGPLRFDMDHATSMDAWPPSDAMLVALPPSASANAASIASIRKRMDATRWNVVISSTSVYPSAPGKYAESDAIHRVSPHSGIDVLSVEHQWRGPNTTLLRAAGLIGPGRPLFRKDRGQGAPDRWLNVVHVDDVVAAIHYCAAHGMQGPVNLAAPARRTLLECGRNGEEAIPLSTEDRRISPELLMDAGFTFVHPDPKSMPDRHTPENHE